MHPEIVPLGPPPHPLLRADAGRRVPGRHLARRCARRAGCALDEDKLVTVILVVLVASVLGARAALRDRARRGVPARLGQRARAVAGRAHALRRHRRRHRRPACSPRARLGLPMWTVADALTPSLALGTVFGRVGCFLNGCCYGRPTALPWGVIVPARLLRRARVRRRRRCTRRSSTSRLAGLGAVRCSPGRCARGSRSPGTLFWIVRSRCSRWCASRST